MSMEWLAPLMFVALIGVLLVGYPVAFALAFVGLVFSTVGIALELFRPELLQALPRQVFDIMQNDILLAIPFFTLMGLILERSGMAEEMLETIGQLFGGVRGGLAYAVIAVGALLAATTGVVAASVIAMGLISLPIMLRYGYDPRIASGVITASGTLAQIVPPSLVLIILADQLSTPIDTMYAGAILPSLILVLAYAGFVCGVSIVRPQWVPALPPEARTVHGLAMVRQVLLVMVPPLTLIFLVLGTIFLGIATPTEGGAMGATGALALAIGRKRLSVKQLQQAVEATMKLSTFVVFILIGARVFRIAFLGVDGDRWVEGLLTSLPGGATGFLIFVNILVFVLAFFLDFFEIAFILVPLLKPVAETLGIDLVWFGVILAVNMQTSFLHPPFGFALFYLKSVAPKSLTNRHMYWGAVPFLIIQLALVATLIYQPKIVTSLIHKEEIVVENVNLFDLTQPAASAPADASAPVDDSDAVLKQLTGE
ncbi:TRAP transporter large permease [Chitinibacteraceae bacterium HSL-7]